MKKTKHTSKYEKTSEMGESDPWPLEETEEAEESNEYIENVEQGEQSDDNEFSSKNNNCRPTRQRHTHEFLGSTKLAELQDDPHNHRFAGVTGQAIKYGRSHVHKIRTNTDFFDHFHEVIVTTGPAIPVGDGRHVHFVMGRTTLNDGHRHKFIFATLIEKPIVD